MMEHDPRLLGPAYRRHLYYFVRKSFGIVNPGKTFTATWSVDAMCRALEKAASGETQRLLIVFRRGILTP
jgi:hypothetical protein